MHNRISISFTVIIPKFKFPHDQTVNIGEKVNVFHQAPEDHHQSIRDNESECEIVLTINSFNNKIMGTLEFRDERPCVMLMFGHIEEQWDDTLPVYVDPKLIELTDAYAYYFEPNDGGEHPSDDEDLPNLAEFKVEDDFYVPPLRFINEEGETCFRMVWTSAYLTVGNNPIKLCYEHDREYGLANRTKCNHFWLDQVDTGTVEQVKEALTYLQLFKDILAFKQIQKGGRPKGSRPRETIATYNKICNLRFSQKYRALSDEKFLIDYPKYNQSQLTRARIWFHQGKPGLKV